MDRRFTTAAEYERIKPFAEYQKAVNTLVKRIEKDGLKKVLDYQIYADPESTKVGAVITYADADAFVEHHEMGPKWEEYLHYRTVVNLVDVRIYGPLTERAKIWLENADLLEKHLGEPVGGFFRTQER